ncbi:HINT domain-containing protein [Streptomyces sp. NBC_01764]|uniref:polymorphic toxin-type HINT domain-containing protein n=1 Tax=Streptomyces sp. NBC_01764 TaxID=2975935 RepID=UPI002255EE58|nr:polymorphic toxin-type HINT domain-containing protein [Streptomyces sp. NBC_01764]MCX4410237.1 HINT domain-containing protein [Streptomyces sp. NBC_01764]
MDRGWTLVSDLHVGDRLRTPDGSVHPVTALLDRSGLTPRTVYDLTVDDLHTFFVLAGATPILVHNCKVALGWQNNGALDAWARLPENKFTTFSLARAGFRFAGEEGHRRPERGAARQHDGTGTIRRLRGRCQARPAGW